MDRRYKIKNNNNHYDYRLNGKKIDFKQKIRHVMVKI